MRALRIATFGHMDLVPAPDRRPFGGKAHLGIVRGFPSVAGSRKLLGRPPAQPRCGHRWLGIGGTRGAGLLVLVVLVALPVLLLPVLPVVLLLLLLPLLLP